MPEKSRGGPAAMADEARVSNGVLRPLSLPVSLGLSYFCIHFGLRPAFTTQWPRGPRLLRARPEDGEHSLPSSSSEYPKELCDRAFGDRMPISVVGSIYLVQTT